MNKSVGEKKLSGDEHLSLIYTHRKLTQVSQVELFCAQVFAGGILGSQGARETPNNQVCPSPTYSHVLMNSMPLEHILFYRA